MRGIALAEGMAPAALAVDNIYCAANIALSAILQVTRRAYSEPNGVA